MRAGVENFVCDSVVMATIPKPLTPKQQRFVEEYLLDLNATQAAIRAGYAPRSAKQVAARLMTNDDLAAAIALRQGARSERVQLSADEVLAELATLVRSDVRNFAIDPDTGELVLRDGAPDVAWRAVSSVKYKTRTIPDPDGDEPTVEREIEFKLWDKNSAIEKAMRHLGLLKDGAALTLNQTNVTMNGYVWKFGDREIRLR